MIENPGKERVLNILHYPKLNALLSISRKHDPEFSDMSFYAVRKWDLNTLTCLGEYVDIVEGRLIPIGDTTSLWGGYIVDVSTMNVDKDNSRTIPIL